jgi:hypothetical protein
MSALESLAHGSSLGRIRQLLSLEGLLTRLQPRPDIPWILWAEHAGPWFPLMGVWDELRSAITLLPPALYST